MYRDEFGAAFATSLDTKGKDRGGCLKWAVTPGDPWLSDHEKKKLGLRPRLRRDLVQAITDPVSSSEPVNRGMTNVRLSSVARLKVIR